MVFNPVLIINSGLKHLRDYLSEIFLFYKRFIINKNNKSKENNAIKKICYLHPPWSMENIENWPSWILGTVIKMNTCKIVSKILNRN